MSQDICQDDKYVPYNSVITVNHLSAELMRGVWELNSDQGFSRVQPEKKSDLKETPD